MKYRIHFIKLLLLCIIIFATGCGGVNSDAKKAASYTRQSIDKTRQLKLEEAEKLFMKSQKIIRKYDSHPKSEQFYKSYQSYRDKAYPNYQEQK